MFISPFCECSALGSKGPLFLNSDVFEVLIAPVFCSFSGLVIGFFFVGIIGVPVVVRAAVVTVGVVGLGHFFLGHCSLQADSTLELCSQFSPQQ